MEGEVQVWAVDVSGFFLWTGKGSGAKDHGNGLLEDLLPTVEERQRVQRYVRQSDQIRCLAGKLLCRLAVCHAFAERQIDWSIIRFATTPHGRPYLVSPPTTHGFDFNLTHDGDWVAIVFGRRHGTPASEHIPMLGIDVMEIHLPSFEKDVHSFVETMDMTLTAQERRWILEGAPAEASGQERPLRRLYTLWTYKEAWTKSLGMGLSFDFARMEIPMWHRNDQGRGTTDPVRIKIADDLKGAVETTGEVAQRATQCVFREVTLPAGQAHASDHTILPGGGTGEPSTLVVCLPHAQQKGEVQIPTLSETHQEAQQQGWLRIFSMDQLVGMVRREHLCT